MPDVFVAPDEKAVRNRLPVTNQHASSQSSIETPDQIVFHTTQPIKKNLDTPIVQDAITLPAEESSIISEAISTSQNNQEKIPSTPSYDDIERRNGIIPLVASFWQNPHSIYFDTQEPDERILLFLRRHFITNLTWIALTVLLVILPPIAVYLLHAISYPITFLPFPLMQIILTLYYLLTLTNAFVNLLDWYYNITIITTKRVLDIQLKDLVNKKVSATKISLVQDVDFKQVGTIPSLFNYGDVIMQTAGKEVNFIADAVPNPELVVQVVESLIGKDEKLKGGHYATP